MRSSVLRKPQTTAGSSREAKQAEEQKGKKVSIPSDIKKKKKNHHKTMRKTSADNPISAKAL